MDFYAAPRPSGDGRIAFLVWDHPNMPFDGCQLLVAEDDGNGLQNPTIAAGGSNESIVQPEWNGERLLFASDAHGYWNLYAYDGSGVYAVLPDTAEYAGPAWQFANTYYVPISANHVVARRVEDGMPSLVLVDLDQGLASPLDDDSSSYLDIVRTPSGIAYIAGFADRPKQIVELRLDTRSRTVIAQPPDPPVAPGSIAVPEALTFPAKAGDSHALFYPPTNRDHRIPAGELPPLLVASHGGPTSNAWPDLDWRVQYYTSRGWSVADVNYGGSTGFGRRLPATSGWRVGPDRCRRLRRLRTPPRRPRSGRSGTGRHQGRQCRGLYHAGGARFHQCLPGGREPLWRRRSPGAGCRHAQVRIPLSRCVARQSRSAR